MTARATWDPVTFDEFIQSRAEKFNGRLADAEKILRSGGWWTAAELAWHLHCSKPTAYAYIRALKKAGKKIQTRDGDSTSSGPPARLYAMKKRAV